MKRTIRLSLGLLLSAQIAFAQNTIDLQISYTENADLQQYYNFEGIDFLNLKFKGKEDLPPYFSLTSHEYFNGKLHKSDTIVNKQKIKSTTSTDSMEITVMAKKINETSSKFLFTLPNLSVFKTYLTESIEMYSLRNLTPNGKSTLKPNQAEDILAYTIPYTKPETPGYKYYCDYTDGIPTDKWGEKYNIQHYIVFKIQFLD